MDIYKKIEIITDKRVIEILSNLDGIDAHIRGITVNKVWCLKYIENIKKVAEHLTPSTDDGWKDPRKELPKGKRKINMYYQCLLRLKGDDELRRYWLFFNGESFLLSNEDYKVLKGNCNFFKKHLNYEIKCFERDVIVLEYYHTAPPLPKTEGKE